MRGVAGSERRKVRVGESGGGEMWQETSMGIWESSEMSDMLDFRI